MKNLRQFTAHAALLVMLGMTLHATAAPAGSGDGVWRDVPVGSIAARGEVLTRPAEFRTVALDDARLLRVLDRASPQVQGGPGVVLTLPMPHGGFERFEIYDSPVMADELAKRYPEIRTYGGHGLDDPTAWVRIDRTPAGFHAMVHGAEGSVYIDPYQTVKGQIVGEHYLSYHKRDVTQRADRRYSCGVHAPASEDAPKSTPAASRTPTGPQLRTYRLAVATTGEYAQFHGGTVPAALAAIVTAINRVTGIYQAELSIRLELIPNNDQIIFTNAATDGYTNNNGFTMLGQNQARLDQVIGSANYDIGHVFSTGGGGVAGLGVVCRANNKGRGVTGLGSPIGDPFYVDFVAHEIGHQFGSNHTFNGTASACGGNNRNGSTAFEPGSGSTIMAYAGICGSHNIANFSDDHFHTSSFDEIVSYTNFGSGDNCAVTTNTGNQAPLVDAGTGMIVPLNTPLRLSGSGNDPDGDTLVYRWEQFDLGPGGSPNAPSGNAPLFRSFSAVSTPTRLLPKLNDILTNSQSVGERLPTYARSLRFRLTALDQQSSGGGVDYDVVTHTVTDQAGPFDMTSQNTTTTWVPGSVETISWDVANTDAAPVNCTEVNILFSSDLGNNFDSFLALFTPNDGSEDIIVPSIQTSVGRVMVECANNIFFDINNVNITILDDPDPDFQIDAPNVPLQVCAPDEGMVDVDVLSIGGFTNPVTLSTSGTPGAISSSFSPASVNAGNSSTLTLGNIASAAPGLYNFTISGSGSTGTRSDTLDLEIGSGVPATPTIASPTNGAVNVDVQPILSWSPAAGVEAYLVEIALDSGFNSVIYSETEPTTSHEVLTTLDFSTDYFFRVSAQNFCGDAISDTVSFRTVSGPAIACAFPNASIPEAGAPLESTLNLVEDGNILEVKVFVDASHGVSGHLSFDVRNESTGTQIALMDQPGAPIFPGGCPTPDVEVNFDDNAAFAAEELCNATVPGIGVEARPDEALATFAGESLQGDWTLVASDGTPGTVGLLNTWCVEITFDEDTPTDSDADGVFDSEDNCTLFPNPAQRDTDGDGYGNFCDADLNNDLIVNAVDLGLFRLSFFTSDGDPDFDGDGVVNVVDLGILRQRFFAPPGPSGVAP
ncbi:MAG: reprolysin-like metallopeptidase [Gammaproteobacteria bacterium]